MKPRVSCSLDVETILEVQFTIKPPGRMDFGSVMNQVLSRNVSYGVREGSWGKWQGGCGDRLQDERIVKRFVKWGQLLKITGRYFGEAVNIWRNQRCPFGLESGSWVRLFFRMHSLTPLLQFKGNGDLSWKKQFCWRIMCFIPIFYFWLRVFVHSLPFARDSISFPWYVKELVVLHL